MRLLLVSLSIGVLSACVIGGGGGFGDDDVGGSDDDWEFDQQLDAVFVQIANGTVTVVNTEDAAWVEWDGGGFGDAASPDVYVEDGILHVDADGGQTGGGDLTVGLPPGVGIGAWIDYGEIDVILDQRSDIVACAVAGDVRVEVPAGAWDIDLDTPIGDTSVSGIDDDPQADWHIRSRITAGSLEITGR